MQYVIEREAAAIDENSRMNYALNTKLGGDLLLSTEPEDLLNHSTRNSN